MVTKSQPIEKYISQFPPDIKKRLTQIRKSFRSIAPKAEESISYGIPTFKLNKKPLIYYAGFKKHISVYPASDRMVNVIKELEKFRVSTGTLQFKNDKPLPIGLIKKAAQYRLKENQLQAKSKK